MFSKPCHIRCFSEGAGWSEVNPGVIAGADQHSSRQSHLVGELDFFDDEFGASWNDTALVAGMDGLAVHAHNVVNLFEWMCR